MTTMNLYIFSRVSELTSTCCRNRSRKAYVTEGQELHANHADFFPQPRNLDTVSHQLVAWRNIIAFIAYSLTFLTISWITICRKWVLTPKLTQSLSSRSAGKYSVARATTSVSTVRITTLRSPCRAQCATWSRMRRVSASSWEHGWRYSTSFMLLCAETNVSSFVLIAPFCQFRKPVCTQTDSKTLC